MYLVKHKATGNLYITGSIHGPNIYLYPQRGSARLILGQKTFDKVFIIENSDYEEVMGINNFGTCIPWNVAKEEEIKFAKSREKEIAMEIKQVIKTSIDTSGNIVHLPDLSVKAKKKRKEREKTNKVKVKQKSPTSKKEKTNLEYTLEKMCLELKIDSSKARTILRKLKIDKPGSRWEWEQLSQYNTIKKQIQGELK